MGLLDSIQSLFPRQERDTSIQGTQEDSVIQPLEEEVKKAKLNPTTVDQIFQLVGSGKALPGTVEFAKALGIESRQHGITPSATFGPFGAIRDMFSPKAQDLARKQQLANKIGTLALEQIVEQKQREAAGPQTLQEAQQALPGVIRPVEAQRGATLDQIVGQGTQGPTREIDPNAPLTPFQQRLAGQTLESLGQGRLFQGEDGIVPTSFATAQGQRLPAEVVAWVDQAALTPPDEPLPTPPRAVPQSIVNRVISERGNINRFLAKGPDLNNRLESLAAVESVRRFGRPMRFGQIAQEDPAFATQLREQAEIQESKDIIAFQNLEGMKRQIAQAGPVATAKFEAERDQPLDQPQLWRDPISGKAASARLTTRQAQKQNFVKLRPDQIETLNQMETIDRGLAEVKEISTKVLSPKRKTALGEAWRAMSQSAKLAFLRATGDPDLLKMDSIITRLTAPLVKSQGDTANIAVAEREMFAQSLVNNRASTEAVVANLDNVIETTKSVRRMMGFNNPEDFEAAMVDSGMSQREAAKLTRKRFKDDPQEAQRARIRELRAQGKSWEDIEKILTSR